MPKASRSSASIGDVYISITLYAACSTTIAVDERSEYINITLGLIELQAYVPETQLLR